MSDKRGGDYLGSCGERELDFTAQRTSATGDKGAIARNRDTISEDAPKGHGHIYNEQLDQHAAFTALGGDDNAHTNAGTFGYFL